MGNRVASRWVGPRIIRPIVWVRATSRSAGHRAERRLRFRSSERVNPVENPPLISCPPETPHLLMILHTRMKTLQHATSTTLNGRNECPTGPISITYETKGIDLAKHHDDESPTDSGWDVPDCVSPLVAATVLTDAIPLANRDAMTTVAKWKGLSSPPACTPNRNRCPNGPESTAE